MAAQKNIAIGETHYEIEQSVNPDRLNAKMKISRTAWNNYKKLHDHSKTARYDGFTDFETFQKLKKLDHLYCVEHLEKFKLYIQGQGVELSK